MAKNQENKIVWLTKMKEMKGILFGSFSETLTKKERMIKWRELHELAIALGLVSKVRTWIYVRDVLWQNIKKSTMIKLENPRITGRCGDMAFKFNDIDRLVLDILGKESPNVKCLDMPEALAPPILCIADPASEPHEQDSPCFLKDIPPQKMPIANKIRKGQKRELEGAGEGNYEMQEKKLKIEQVKLQNYKMKLEIFKMEKELGVPPSEYTKDLWDRYISKAIIPDICLEDS